MFRHTRTSIPEYDEAEAVARAWVEARTQGDRELDPQAVIVRPYGWAFGFRDARRGHGVYIGGWIGVLIDRVSGDVLAIGVGESSMDAFLARYEATIPVARLTMKPQFPPTGTHYRGLLGVIDPDKAVDVTTLPEVHRRRIPHRYRPWWRFW